MTRPFRFQRVQYALVQPHADTFSVAGHRAIAP
jgi:hypothetical protein